MMLSMMLMLTVVVVVVVVVLVVVVVVVMVVMMMMMMFRYGVVVDGERGNRPNILAQEDLLSHTVSFLHSAVFF